MSVSVAEHSKHKYIAVHETVKRAHLFNLLKENLGPDARAWQMDNRKNRDHEIVFGTEVVVVVVVVFSDSKYLFLGTV